jgi:predicted RNase H-like HicB family nuclease
VKRYAVIIEHDPITGSYGAYAPDLPGCGAVGDTHAEVLQLIQEAIELHLQGLREEGLPIPEPSTEVEYVETSLPAT